MPIQRTCARCSAVFLTYPCRLKRGRDLYCSYGCAFPTQGMDGPTRLAHNRAPRDPVTGCDEWTGARQGVGYGWVYWKGRPSTAHRLAWDSAPEALPVPKGYRVLHVCDNPACTRNDDVGTYTIPGTDRAFPRRGHLWLGTAKDNTADMWAKGRGVTPTVGRH